jgi:hypothetical protein
MVAKQEKEMNEWGFIAGGITLFITISGFIFGWGWKIIQDVKNSAHKRIDRVETRVNDYKKDIDEKTNGFAKQSDITEIADSMSKQHGELASRVDNFRGEVTGQFAGITTRIDNLIMAVNGKSK